jgi:hypothetical protein
MLLDDDVIMDQVARRDVDRFSQCCAGLDDCPISSQLGCGSRFGIFDGDDVNEQNLEFPPISAPKPRPCASCRTLATSNGNGDRKAPKSGPLRLL